ncbi:MAG: RnfABCDGE type electron transport complex subunit D [Anaerococcus sp.]
MELKEKLLVTSSPHMRSDRTITKEMLDVIIALIPTGLVGAYFFGLRALLVIGTCVISCVVAEMISNKVMKRESTIGDLSAVVTGILLAYNVSVTMPIWQMILGSFFAIVVAKQFFGGIGQNVVNPALAARAFLMASWSGSMTYFVAPGGVSAIASATPLSGGEQPSIMNMFIGNMGGCIGEVSTLAIIIGGIYLIYRKVIDPKVPLIYIATTAILLIVFNKSTNGIIEQLLSGGLFLGAFFMATDYVTIPVTPKGRIIFAIGCGLLTAIIRKFGGYPEGVSYAILLMNLTVPLIEEKTRPKVFGVDYSKKEAENE